MTAGDAMYDVAINTTLVQTQDVVQENLRNRISCVLYQQKNVKISEFENLKMTFSTTIGFGENSNLQQLRRSAILVEMKTPGNPKSSGGAQYFPDILRHPLKV
jgi:hypothetical protein